ncbi:ABC transporter permease [Actinomyces slackii]|uniref:FtsX-like permease family n=1 Tax=Actinomyces slackii TaxID=52774 RepID=A0A448KGA7_9ACTO|nr:ABC transporter permease [Actinomyces slackii]VEG75932.1 FtsX-like permease family [Actinomyces slackii]
MREFIRLVLALFRTSWVRSATTILGIAATTAMSCSVLLVINAFESGIRDQLDGLFHSHNRIVLTQTGGPMTREQIESLAETAGEGRALPLAQHEAMVDGEKTVLLVIPDDRSQDASPAERDQVWLSSTLRASIGGEVGESITVRVGAKTWEAAIGPDPSSQGHPEFDRSTYAVVSASTLARLGHAELGAPNAVLVDADSPDLLRELEAYAQSHPGLLLQDRSAADALLRTGIDPVLKNLPLVAVMAFLLSLVLIFTITRSSADSQRQSFLLLRALGASAGRLRGLAVASGLGHGVLGLAVGLLAAAHAADALMESIPAAFRNSAAPMPEIPLSPQVYIGVSSAVLLICVIASRSGVRPIISLSTEDQYRGEARQRRWTTPLAATCGALAVLLAVLAVRWHPRDLGTLGLFLLMLGWVLLGSVLIAVLLRCFDRLVLRSRPGFVSRSADRRVAAQMQSGALVVSGALVLLVSLSGLATNLQRSIEPTMAGMGDIELLAQDAAPDDLPTIRNMPASSVESVEGVDGVTHVRPIQMGYITHKSKRVLIQGVSEGSQLPVVQQAEAAGGRLAPGSAFISTQFAEQNDLSVGDVVTLRTPDGATVRLTVDAVVHSFLWPGGLVAMSIEDSRRLWPQDGVSALEISCSLPWQDVASTIRSRLGDLGLADTTVLASGPDQSAQASKVVEDSTQLYRSLAMIGLFVAMLIASSAITLDTSRRLKEFGIVRAVGARGRFLVSMVVTRAALLVAPAVVVGGLFGVLLLWMMTQISAESQGASLRMHWSGSTTAGAALACLAVIGVSAVSSARLVTRRPAPEMLGSDE